MVFISITGLIILFQLPKRKKIGLTFIAIGGVLSVAAYFVLIR